MIADDGEQLGIMNTGDAIRLAQQRELDLVEVAAAATPPVCRIMDYGKYRYTQKKKAQESRKKVTAVVVKEVKVGSMTGEHDVQTKVRHARDFLAEGYRVKVSVWFRGRAITHPELGEVMLRRISTLLVDAAIVEQPPRLEGRAMSMILIKK